MNDLDAKSYQVPGRYVAGQIEGLSKKGIAQFASERLDFVVNQLDMTIKLVLALKVPVAMLAHVVLPIHLQLMQSTQVVSQQTLAVEHSPGAVRTLLFPFSSMYSLNVIFQRCCGHEITSTFLFIKTSSDYFIITKDKLSHYLTNDNVPVFQCQMCLQMHIEVCPTIALEWAFSTLILLDT